MTLEELAYLMDKEAHYAGDDTDPRRLMFAAAAACVREAENSRRPMSLQMPGMRKATDAALAKCGGGA